MKFTDEDILSIINSEDTEVYVALGEEILKLRTALRKAPMPYAESILDEETWSEEYDKWWHENASEASILRED